MNRSDDIEPRTKNLAPEDLIDYSNLIKQRAQFFKEENSKMKEVFKRLKLVSGDMSIAENITGMRDSADGVDQVLAEIKAKSQSSQKAELARAEKMRKHNNYLSKLKICIRHYINLNENISKEIKTLKSELEYSKQNIGCVSEMQPQDIQQLEDKAKKYENELVKFEKKYPWLKQPDYDLPQIAKHIDNLKCLKEEKENLLKELSVYQNLKPDIKEAKQQLTELKDQVKTVRDNFKV